MVNLIILVTQTNLTNVLSNWLAINYYLNSQKRTKRCTGKQKLRTREKQPQGSKKKPIPKINKTDGNPNWKKLQTKFANPNQLIPFTENPGIKKRNADAANTPLDHFSFFHKMILSIKLWPKQTYIMIKQVKSSKSATKFFTPTYQEKIMAFFGIILVRDNCKTAGNARLLEKRNYFHALVWKYDVL